MDNTLNRYTEIFRPIQIGHLRLKNRVIMGPVMTGLEKSYQYDALAKFYAERARGGVSLITVGGFSFSRLGSYEFAQARFTSETQVSSHRVITDAIHEEGAFALLSLTHVGAQALHPLAVNPKTKREEGHIAFRMPTPVIRSTIERAQKTALLAQKAHYDGVEIDITQNRLLNSFATPGLNQRNDEWGKTPENRFRFAIEMVKSIRETAGSEFIIAARLSLMDFHIEGKTWEETILFAKDLMKVGVNLFTFDFGTHYMNIPVHHGLTPEDAWVPFVEYFSQEIPITVVFAGSLQSPAIVNDALSKNSNTAVELTRALIVDPFWLKKLTHHAERLIIACTDCNQGCSIHHVLKHGQMSCMMNPSLFENPDDIMQQTTTPKKILIVGAGPSGLACAVFASRRGHDVTVYEENDDIGGQLRYLMQVPGKQKYKHLIELFRRLCNRFDIRIETNKRVTIQDQEELQLYFDKIVFATGSTPSWVDIQGAPSSKVYQFPDIFEENTPVGNRVVVIGNNPIALDVATFLVHKNTTPPTRDNWLAMWGIGDPRQHRAGVVGVIPKAMKPYRQVCLLSRTQMDYGVFIDEDMRAFELQWLRILGIKTFTNVNIENYDSTNLHISFGKHHSEPDAIACDHIVICSTPHANDGLAKRYIDSGVDATVIGAAKATEQARIKTILECLREGIELGSKL